MLSGELKNLLDSDWLKAVKFKCNTKTKISEFSATTLQDQQLSEVFISKAVEVHPSKDTCS